MITEVLSRHYPQKRPNRDRDPNRHDCFRYNLVLVRASAPQEFVIAEADDFDSFHHAIDGAKAKYRDLRSKAFALSDFLGVPVRETVMKKTTVTIETWNEEPLV